MTSCTATNQQKKKIKCFGRCDLNDTLHLSPTVARSLALSRSCAPALCHSVEKKKSFVVQWREKMQREKQIIMCSRFYLYKWEMEQQKKKLLAQFLCNIIRYMLLMFDLWHPPGWRCRRQRGGGMCGASGIDVVKCHTVPHRHDKALCVWTTASMKWFGLFLYYLEDITRWHTFWQTWVLACVMMTFVLLSEKYRICCFLKIVSALLQSLMWQFINFPVCMCLCAWA